LEGRGRYFSPGQFVYVGNIEAGSWTGEGVSYYSDIANSYKGQWKSGVKNGYGEYYDSSGAKYSGQYERAYR